MDTVVVTDFFISERFLNNNLESISKELSEINEKIKSGTFCDISLDMISKTPKEVNSYSSYFGKMYNLFLEDVNGLKELGAAIKDMVDESLNYYNIKDVSSSDYKITSWFNYHGRSGKQPLHDHNHSDGSLFLHGYYCVNAEPSNTHYEINGNLVDFNNSNNRAILFKNGHKHGIGDWPYDNPRITIAYDVVPVTANIPDRKWVSLDAI